MIDFAILAPVPVEHLQSGLLVVATKPYVAYGSMKWELFRRADELRGSDPVPMLIYPSHESASVTTSFEIKWTAWYVGHVQEYAKKHADEVNGHRPDSTTVYPEDNARHWGVFWHVEKLGELPSTEHRPISSLSSYGKGYWRQNSPPRGPEIVARPSWI